MQLAVKTLKGEKFTVNAEESNTIAEIKVIIVSAVQSKSLFVIRYSLLVIEWLGGKKLVAV